MKLFNYERIFIVSHGVPSKMLKAFNKEKTGPNFIINQKVLVDSFWLSDRQKAEYLGICALRSYEDYLFGGVTTLSIHSVPKYVPLEIIRENPLITIENEIIIFNKEQ